MHLRASPTISIFLFTFVSHPTEKYATPFTNFHKKLTNNNEVLIKNKVSLFFFLFLSSVGPDARLYR
jgi:hypothetical protein